MNQIDPQRDNLLRQAAAAIELKTRRLRSKTVYGMVGPDGTTVRRVVELGGVYVDTDDKPTVLLPAKLERFVTTKKRFKVAYGGRGSGKSYSFGSVLVARAKDYQAKIACFREVQNSIEDSVHALLKGIITSTGYNHFKVTDTAIRIDGSDVFKFRGLGHKSESVKSLFGFNHGWCEEAQALSEKSLSDLTPTFREEDAEIWFSLNPQSSSDPLAKRFIVPHQKELDKVGFFEDDLHLIVNINYTDNPWFPASLDGERKWDFDNIERSVYDHIWLGAYNDSIENSLIKSEWFDACVDAHTRLGFSATGARIFAHDPSDTGPDDKAIAFRHGSVFSMVASMATGNVNEGCDWATGEAIKLDTDQYIFDGDGMGIALARQTAAAFEGKSTTIVVFKGSESVDHPGAIYAPAASSSMHGQKTNKETFRNKRAQYYFALRDRMFKTYIAVTTGEYTDPNEMLSFAGDMTEIKALKAELCRMPIKPNANGTLELYRKDEMKSRFKLASPNIADAVMMTMRYVTTSIPTTQRPAPIRPIIPRR